VVFNMIVSLVAILALSFLGWHFVNKGIDGTIAILIVGSIAGIAGYNAKEIIAYVKDKTKGGS
jgi:divalent metal cation (Fe/Co/Zn/Cd) transporter